MKRFTDIFSALGERLATFGHDAASRRAIDAAISANEWFTEADICRAVAAIRDRMLRRGLIEAWLARYPQSGASDAQGASDAGARCRIAVIMAGNIPLVGFFDLMCVLAAGAVPYIKMSAKDSVLMSYVIELLRDIEPAIRIETYRPGLPFDGAIATGGDSANIHFRNAFAGIPCLLRGNRHSAAVLTGRETAQMLDALADDIFSYSGLGCRNVSLLFVPRGFRPTIPARRICRGYRNNYLRCRALLTMTGTPFDDTGEAVVVRGEASFPRELSRINVAEYDSPDEVRQWLAANDGRLQCVVSSLRLHDRTVPFGQAQYPSLTDYADDADTMAFLASVAEQRRRAADGGAE